MPPCAIACVLWAGLTQARTTWPVLWVSASVFLLATLSALLLQPVRLTDDRPGLRLSSALSRIPLIRAGLDEIDEVLADTIEPTRLGGWGYYRSETIREHENGRRTA